MFRRICLYEIQNNVGRTENSVTICDILRRVIKFQVTTFRCATTQQTQLLDEWSTAKPYDSVPGPKPAPIIGNMWRFFPVIGTYNGLEQHEINIKQNQEYGALVRLRGLKVRADLVLCFNPQDIETVFRNEGPFPRRNFLESVKYHREVMNPHIFNGFYGIFSADDEEWQKARSIMNPILMQTKTVKNYVEPIGKVADQFIERVKVLAKMNRNSEMPSDFSFELSKWSLESVCVMMLDTEIGLLDPNPNPEAQKYLTNVLNYFDLLYKVDIEPCPWRYISTPTWRKYIKTSDDVISFIRKLVQKATLKAEAEGENELSILQRMLKSDRKYLLGIILDMMIAGVDTTSTTMSSMLYYLSTNRKVQDKLRNEVISVLPSRDTNISSQMLDKMPYLRAVIKESLRIAPIALGVARQTTRDQVLSGYRIPKGTDLMLCNLALCKKSEYFTQPEKFVPERWLRQDGTRQEINPWVYLPFGHGPRSCVGRRLANMELEILLAKIIRNFKIHWSYGEAKYKMMMMYSIASPLKIKFEVLDS